MECLGSVVLKGKVRLKFPLGETAAPSLAEGHMAQSHKALSLLVRGVGGPLQSRCMTTDGE